VGKELVERKECSRRTPSRRIVEGGLRSADQLRVARMVLMTPVGQLRDLARRSGEIAVVCRPPAHLTGGAVRKR